MRYCFLLGLTVGTLVGAASRSRADTWSSPSPATFLSKNKEYRFLTTPADPTARARAALLEALTPQVKDKLAAAAKDNPGQKEPPAQVRAAQKPGKCWGRLEHKTKNGKYELVWEHALSNDVAPVGALVSDDGKHVVTLDNWHSVGRGSNVVAIYGPKGKLVRELGLSDFLSREQVAGFPKSVSSTWWGHGHSLDEKSQCVVLRVAKNRDWMESEKPAQFQEIRLSLETGKAPRQAEMQKSKAALSGGNTRKE
jgi:hypothetical protein